MKVTVILCTKRMNPRFDWAIESLNKQTFRDFEYIIVDGLYEHRKKDVKTLIEARSPSFPYLHIPDKPCRWGGKRPAISNARNTGLIFANGEYIIFHDDCCKFPSNWLEMHMKWLSRGYLVAGSYIGYEKEDPYGKGICPYGWEDRAKLMKEAGIIHGGWFYSCNCSFPLNVALEINGFDEELDGEMGQEDISFGIRAERRGYKIIYDPDCYVEFYHGSHGLFSVPDATGGLSEFKTAPINKKLKDGKDHFSNEWLTEKLLEDTGRLLPYGNDFDLGTLRKLAEENGIERTYELMKEFVDIDPWDWRDGRLIEDKIKEKAY